MKNFSNIVFVSENATTMVELVRNKYSWNDVVNGTAFLAIQKEFKLNSKMAANLLWSAFVTDYNDF